MKHTEINTLAYLCSMRASLVDTRKHVNKHTEYKFDTLSIFGDYTIIYIPEFFADEKTARHELYNQLADLI